MKVIMSIYLINKILYLTDNDPEFRKRIKADPEGTVRSFPLNEAELKALTSGDVGALYQMGVHTFMLNHLSRYELFGVNRDNYLDRIRTGMEYDERFKEGWMPVQKFVEK